MDSNVSVRLYKYLITVAAALSFALLLSSCRPGAEPQGARQKALSFLSSCRVETAGQSGGLYDLTALSSDKERTLCAYGVYDETHILLLTAEDRPAFGPDSKGPAYTADLLDLTDGSRRELVSFECAGTLNGFSDGTQFLEIISAQPLVVYDSLNGMLYAPRMTPSSLVLPGWLNGASVHCLGGKLYLSSERGFLYDTSPDGELHAVWRLPHTFHTFTPVKSGHEGVLTFSTRTFGEDTGEVLVDIDPVSGESRYYRSSLSQERFLSDSEGLVLASSFDREPLLTVCDPAASSQKTLHLPERITERLSGNAEGTGSFVSLQTAPRSLGSGWCCWSLSDGNGRPESLYLWDTLSASASGWEAPSQTDWAGPSPEEYGEISRRAAQLEEQYGVTIVLGRNVPLTFSDYSASPETSPDLMDGTLSVLENVLSRYPAQYFDALKGTYYREIVFYLTGDLAPLDQTANISNAGAFATERDGLCQIALNLLSDPDASMVIHELTHAADYRFAGQALWDEDAWNAMNPPGFSYYNSYIDEQGESYEYSGSSDHTADAGGPADEVYFIDAYSKTFGMEDRARLMENLMVSGSPYAEFYRGKHLQEKLSYYFRFLRDTLSDESWPPATEWEEALESASVTQ